MSEHQYGGEILFRVAALEKEMETQRQRIHNMSSELQAMRLMIQTNTDAIRYMGDSVAALRKSVIQVGVGFVTAAIIFAISVLSVFGGP